MIDISLKESRTDGYAKANDGLKSDYLYPDDWESLRTMHTALESFYFATLAAQGSNGFLHESLLNIDILKRSLGRNIVGGSAGPRRKKPELVVRSESALQVLLKYWNLLVSETPYYMAAIALHPSFRSRYFRENWNTEEQQTSQWKNRLNDLWVTYKDSSIPLGSPPSTLYDLQPKPLRIDRV